MRIATIAFAIAAILSVPESSVAAESPQPKSAANSNASRPGAGAPNCAKLVETADKCVFHTKKGQRDAVRLPLAEGVTWTATASDPAVVEISKPTVESLPDGSKQYVMSVVPTTPGDADVILKLEKRIASTASPTETRSIHLMIHALPADGAH